MDSDVVIGRALRGYDRGEGDALLDLVRPALISDEPAARRAAQQALSAAAFNVRMRGYDKGQVESYVTQVRSALGVGDD